MAFSATDFIGSLLPNYKARDTVGIFDEFGQQLFTEARSIKARVSPSAKQMQHPAENGVTITDHRIINPVSIELSLIIAAKDYKNVYENLYQAFQNGDFLSIHVKAKVYDKQVIEALPHEEDPERHDTLLIALKTIQIQYVTSQFSVQPKDPINATTIPQGTKAATGLSFSPDTITSYLRGAF
jgi:hypothetical protein